MSALTALFLMPDPESLQPAVDCLSGKAQKCVLQLFKAKGPAGLLTWSGESAQGGLVHMALSRFARPSEHGCNLLHAARAASKAAAASLAPGTGLRIPPEHWRQELLDGRPVGRLREPCPAALQALCSSLRPAGLAAALAMADLHVGLGSKATEESLEPVLAFLSGLEWQLCVVHGLSAEPGGGVAGLEVRSCVAVRKEPEPEPLIPATMPACKDLEAAVEHLLAAVRAGGALAAMPPVGRRPELQLVSPFGHVLPELKDEVLRLAAAEPPGSGLDRAIGCLVGLAVADGLGHMFEFMDARDTHDAQGTPLAFGSSEPFFRYPSDKVRGGEFCNFLNRFKLRRGQWTDDASMALCLADSLLLRGDYDGGHARTLFYHWWFNGLDNAFRLDTELHRAVGTRNLSVGLGGNVSKSLRQLLDLPPGAAVPPRFEADTEDAGNGSLMRLGPVPLWMADDAVLARELAFESSLTTHPGMLAAEACAFLAHVTVRAMALPAGPAPAAASFIDAVVAEYLALLEAPLAPAEAGGKRRARARAELRRLLLSQEPKGGKEACWNWRSPRLHVEATLEARGQVYNGHPVSAGYFGSFSLDAVAVALHCVYHTSSFNDAIVRCINLLGDADSTGAVCAQVAGALYGAASIEPAWVEDLRRWDHREVELRAVALAVAALAQLGQDDEELLMLLSAALLGGCKMADWGVVGTNAAFGDRSATPEVLSMASNVELLDLRHALGLCRSNVLLSALAAVEREVQRRGTET